MKFHLRSSAKCRAVQEQQTQVSQSVSQVCTTRQIRIIRSFISTHTGIDLETNELHILKVWNCHLISPNEIDQDARPFVLDCSLSWGNGGYKSDSSNLSVNASFNLDEFDNEIVWNCCDLGGIRYFVHRKYLRNLPICVFELKLVQAPKCVQMVDSRNFREARSYVVIKA